MTSTYSMQDHIHNYAVWTAARAVQRGFVKTKFIQQAIDTTRLQAFAKRELVGASLTDNFDAFHQESCQKIIGYFAEREEIKDCSYGRAAKIMAIYLKTAVILPTQGTSPSANDIHPPIDRILLERLRQEPAFKDIIPYNTRWTKLKEDAYWKLWEQLAHVQKKPYWMLEEFWTATEKEKEL